MPIGFILCKRILWSEYLIKKNLEAGDWVYVKRNDVSRRRIGFEEGQGQNEREGVGVSSDGQWDCERTAWQNTGPLRLDTAPCTKPRRERV